ncbi:MAG: hypothetical protein QE280_08495 [Caulobacter sp.]|nr:hypothetical protein [Caulobacter sp.]
MALAMAASTAEHHRLKSSLAAGDQRGRLQQPDLVAMVQGPETPETLATCRNVSRPVVVLKLLATGEDLGDHAT